MKKKTYLLLFCVSALLALLGLFAISCTFWWSIALQSTAWWQMCLYGGLLLCIVAVALFAVALIGKKLAKRPAEKQETMADVSFKMQETASGVATYVPTETVYSTQPVATRQTDEEKLEQIAKMDKTQFVVFVASLFSKRGYQVKLTPVVENHNVDVLLTRFGATIALGVLHSQKVLSAEQLQPVLDGAQFYSATEIIVVTNNYFDRSAVEFAKHKGLSLVDRNLLITEFFH